MKKLEHRKQKVIPITHFIIRLGRYGVFALLLIGISVMIGALGYHQVGKLDWLDSFYMACMILTGMGPIADMTSDNANCSLHSMHSTAE